MGLLETLIVVCLILWALGFLGGVAFGGLIHVLIVIALILLIVRLMKGRPL